MSTAPRYVPLPDIAIALEVGITYVHQLIRDRQLLAVRQDGVRRVPAEFVQDGAVVKSLPATITLLADAGYADEEIIDWLFTADESCPGGRSTRCGRTGGPRSNAGPRPRDSEH